MTKLFGLFDHEIRLNLEERITIIHGPNGFGKTIVLRMVAALISGDYELLREIPFQTFVIESDCGLRLAVEREEERSPDEAKLWKPDIFVGVYEPGGSEPRFWYKTQTRSDEWGRTLTRRGPRTSRNVVKRYAEEPDWTSKARANFPKVHLILTQRLEYNKEQSRPKVQEYSDALSKRIQQALAEYAARSQELDRNFPTRLLSRTKEEVLTAERLRQRLASLEEKRSDLTHLGFLEPEHEPALSEASVNAIETKRDVLTVYVNDMESKFAIFDEMASKIKLFTRIVNSRFILKNLSIHKDEGFVFTSATGAPLKPSHLSSGEQHELILLYELLFQMGKNELILIDEPEISLHVAWQEKFLKDLDEVVKLSEIDVLIATHSPEIIGEHWNLTVELKGPAELHAG